MIALMMLRAAPEAASNFFVADPNAAGTLNDPSTASLLGPFPQTTSNAVCTSSPLEPATIAVTGMAQKVGQPVTDTVTLLASCQSRTANPARSTETGAEDIPWHFTQLAYDPPAAADLAGVRAPDGASVLSGPPDAGSEGRALSRLAETSDIGSELTDLAAVTYAYHPPRDASGADVQRSTTARADALSVTVAKVRDLGMATLVPESFRLTSGAPDQSGDASTLYRAPPLSSVFITWPDTTPVFPADDFAWHADAIAQIPNPGSVRAAAHPVLSATVARQGANPTYARVLVVVP